MLRGLNFEFYHQTVTTQQVENYIASHTGLELTTFFDQYLRNANLPEMEYNIKHGYLNYRLNKIVTGFTLPMTVYTRAEKAAIIPCGTWKQVKWTGGYNVKFSSDFLIKLKE